jgi:hypothetical protein
MAAQDLSRLRIQKQWPPAVMQSATVRQQVEASMPSQTGHEQPQELALKDHVIAFSGESRVEFHDICSHPRQQQPDQLVAMKTPGLVLTDIARNQIMRLAVLSALRCPA